MTSTFNIHLTKTACGPTRPSTIAVPATAGARRTVGVLTTADMSASAGVLMTAGTSATGARSDAYVANSAQDHTISVLAPRGAG